MIRVLVVDDHAVVRSGIMHIIAEAKDILSVDEAARASQALELARSKDYDIIVLDVRLPDGSGLDVLKQIRTFKPQQHILMLSMYPERQYATRALKAGALGYLTKDSIPNELVAAIHKVARGERYVSESLGEFLANQMGKRDGREPHELLSDREYQVMCMFASGKTVSQIAKELALSVKTVSTYRTRLLEKMALGTTAELIVYALERGLCG